VKTNKLFLTVNRSFKDNSSFVWISNTSFAHKPAPPRRAFFLLAIVCLGASALIHAQTSDLALAAALADLNKGRVLEAIVKLKQIVRDDAQSGAAHFYLASLYTEMGEFDMAQQYLERAVAASPKRGAYFHQIGMIRYRQRNWREALAFFERALEAGAGPDEATVWRSIGEVQKELFDWDKAVKAYENALRIRPNEARTHLLLGQLQLDQNNLEGATLHLRAALEIDPSLQPAHASLGRAYRRIGATAAATATLRKAVELNPSDQESRYALGQALLAIGRRTEGRQELETYQRVQDRITRANSNYDAGIARIEAGELADAEKLLAEAVELAPTYGLALYSLGAVRLDRGNPGKALQVLERAVTANPLNAEIHFRLGSAYARTGKLQNALEATRNAIVLRDEDARYHRQMGELYLKLNRTQEANDAFKKASELH
jgi:tetratricopeptide (TPR) repeat protein